MSRAAPALAALALLSASRAALAQDAACKGPFERAQELRQETKLVASRAELDACVRACPAELGEQCKIWIGEIEAQIGHLVIVAVDAQGRAQDGAQIQLDGRTVGRDEWTGAIRVDPGTHAVVAKAGGRTGSGSITIKPGASERLTVRLDEPPATAASGAPAGGPRAPLPGAALALGGVGIAVALAGAGAAIAGQVLASSYAGRCRERDPACSVAGAEAWRGEVSALWIGGGVAAGAGAALLAAGVLRLVLHRPEPAPRAAAAARPFAAAVELTVRPGGLGLGVSF